MKLYNIPEVKWQIDDNNRMSIYDISVSGIYNSFKCFDEFIFSEKIIDKHNDLQKIEFRLFLFAIIIDKILKEHWLLATYISDKLLDCIKAEMSEYVISNDIKLNIDNYAVITIEFYREYFKDFHDIKHSENYAFERMPYLIKIISVYERLFLNPLNDLNNKKESLISFHSDFSKIENFAIILPNVFKITHERMEALDGAFKLCESSLKSEKYFPKSNLDSDIIKKHIVAEKNRILAGAVEGWLRFHYELINLNSKLVEVNLQTIKFKSNSDSKIIATYNEIVYIIAEYFSLQIEDAEKFSKIAIQNIILYQDSENTI
jgi:hypothetical protein